MNAFIGLLVDAARPVLVKVLAERVERVRVDRVAHFAASVQVVVQVVDRVQLRAEDLAAAVQVVQVGAR